MKFICVKLFEFYEFLIDKEKDSVFEEFSMGVLELILLDE